MFSCVAYICSDLRDEPLATCRAFHVCTGMQAQHCAMYDAAFCDFPKIC